MQQSTRLFILLPVAIYTFIAPQALHAQTAANIEQPPAAQVEIQLPKTFPTEIPAAISGTLTNANTRPTQFLLQPSAWLTAATPAQRDSQTGQVWLLATVTDDKAPGTSTVFQAQPTSDEPAVTITAQDEGFQFLDSGRPVMFYQQKDKSLNGKYTRSNYVHPLLGLDGEVLTQDFPSDHYHHRGVFWAWHQILVGDRPAGDAWINQNFATVVRQADVIDEGPVFATLKVNVDWISPLITDGDGQSTPIVAETTTIRLFRAVGDVQFVDFRIELRPLLPDVKIGGAENSRGYSGFTVRVKPPTGQQIVDAGGLLRGDNIGTPSPWADVSGRFGDREAVSGIAILSHPSLPEFPPKWLLRQYGMQNVVYPGQHPIALPADKPLVLQHRLVLHRGDVKQGAIEQQQQAYEFSPK